MTNKQKKSGRFAGTALALIALAPATAWAQVADGSADGGEGVDIVVTAQKREQRLADVPLSVAAIGSEQLSDAGISSVQGLTMLAPGLQFSQTVGRQTTNAIIRGISPQGFADPTVQVLIDGFTLGFTRNGLNSQIFDLERVEILKGPQPTLYGRNALGGVINFVTRKPGNTFEGSLSAEAATYGNYRLSGSVSGPIVPGILAGQIGGSYRKSGGFLDNKYDGAKDVNDERDIDVRGSLRFTPSDALEVTFTATHSDGKDACGDCSFVPPGTNPLTAGVRLDIGKGLVNFNEFDLTIDQDAPGFYTRKETTLVLNTAYDFGGVTLTSITGGARQKSVVQPDFNRAAGPTALGAWFNIGIVNQAWSQELRLASDDSGRFIWLLGGYAYQNKRDSVTTYGAGGGSTNIRRVTNFAGFANAEFKITDTLSVIGGLRYDWEKNSSETAGVTIEQTGGEWLPTATISYRPSRNFHVYATYSKGYHSGGPNDPAFSPPNAANYSAEFLTNYEVGIKGSLDEGRFSYTVAGFWMDWTNQQIQRPFGLRTYIENAGKSRIKGAEASVSIRPVAGLNVDASFSYIDSEFLTYLDPISATAFGISPDLSGKRLPYSPEFSSNFSIQYVTDIGTSGWSMRLRGDVNMVSERAFTPTNLLVAQGYALANLYAGVKSASGLEVGLFADNVFDERYLVGGSLSTATFPPLLTVGRPRVVGVRAEFRF